MAHLHRRKSGKQNNQKLPRLEVHIKYENPLPEVPFPPKFLPHPLEIEQFAEYDDVNDLTNQCRQRFLVGRDVGAPVNLLNEEAYEVPDLPADLDPADEELLQDDDLDKTKAVGTVASTFLRKPEYLSADTRALGMGNGEQEKEEAVEAETDQLQALEEQRKAIESTFDKVKTIPAHPTKSHLQPTQVFEILPHAEHYSFSYAQGVFDTDPTPSTAVGDLETMRRLDHALLLNAQQHSGSKQQKTAEYFIPTEDTFHRQQQLQAQEQKPAVGEEFTFEKVREYAYTVRQQDTSYLGTGHEDMYAFVEVEEEGVPNLLYIPLKERVQLSKRARKKTYNAPEELRVFHRDYDEDERRVHQQRLADIGIMGGDGMDDAFENSAQQQQGEQQQDQGQEEQAQQEKHQGSGRGEEDAQEESGEQKQEQEAAERKAGEEVGQAAEGEEDNETTEE